MIFFRPTEKFIQWLKSYADGRFVVDVGCGEGCLLHHMKKAGIPCIGVDPYPPIIPDFDRNFDTPVELITRQLGEESSLIQKDNALIVIARPCHSGFTEDVIARRNPKTELLYIGLPKNVKRDLGSIKHNIILNSEVGDEGEKVYRIAPGE